MRQLARLFVIVAFILPSSLCRRTNQTIDLVDLNSREIKIQNNLTDFLIQISPSFSCPDGFHCEVVIVMKEMDCSINGAIDPDPTYINFIPLRTLYGRENFGRQDWDMICEKYEALNGKAILGEFSLASALIQPVGSKWNSKSASVTIFAKIKKTPARVFVMGESVRDLEVRITNSVRYEIRLDESDLEACEGCSYSVLPLIKEMQCTASRNSSLHVLVLDREGVEISSVRVCETSSKPMDVVVSHESAHSVILEPLGDWIAHGTHAVVSLNVQLLRAEGSCPKGYFNCNHYDGGNGEGDAIAICILKEFACDKRPHCGGQFNDEFELECKHLAGEPSTNHFDTVAIHLIQLFLLTTLCTALLLVAHYALFNNRLKSFEKTLHRTNRGNDSSYPHVNHPNFISMYQSLEKSNRKV